MKQQHLIKRIIQATGFDKSSLGTKTNPAIKPLLFKDEDGPPRKHQWHYRSLIGMSNYLEKTTRPDLAFPVHQCARFCEQQKLSHEKVFHRIVKYLNMTKDKTIIFKPVLNEGIVCYADADFAGGWNPLDSNNPANVLSRSGFVIFYAGCPLTWHSKLQTEIALSTTKSEYIALS